ncbi:uncharacterized protein LOC107823133 isoform X1 [Nicotiana tabacum]|uniref:ATP-dependent RNA helicase glh-1 isoform X1 n=2 Tax=Nicotiana tabacum TaxID=4097 RepID=A0A1S4CVS0_TOBAC|nr:PREDICTED: ATP-dependent RNA helicase glh-1-like isoform X1 [Nicotiana tabacum]
MASTVTEQCLSSPKGGEGLSADILKTQSKPPMVDEERIEEQETVVHAATDAKQVMVLETELFGTRESLVMQALLRAPRYFDYKGSKWETCQRCGEENHGAARCSPLEKKKRPCFRCGHYGHNGKYCKKIRGCFTCKRRGHLARDCPDTNIQILQEQSCEFCLKCGDTGHDMFTCKDCYSSSDLEKIQCWVCKAFGHLCCIDYKDYRPRQTSCYNCGNLGHLGSDCLNLCWNIRPASLSCNTGGTGPSSEANNAVDHTLQEGKDGDINLLCEDSKSAKVSSDVLGSEVAPKKIRRSRWRKRKQRQKKTLTIAEDGRSEMADSAMQQQCQSSEDPKSNVLLKPEATFRNHCGVYFGGQSSMQCQSSKLPRSDVWVNPEATLANHNGGCFAPPSLLNQCPQQISIQESRIENSNSLQ